MNDEQTRARWREKSRKRYELIRSTPELKEAFNTRARERHRKTHNVDPANYRGKYRTQPHIKAQRRELVNRCKLEAGACHDCGLQITEHNLYKFDYDHRDPTSKRFTLSAAKTYSEETILAEIAKCDVVCKNCHADRTHLQQREVLSRKKSEGRKRQIAND
jgi:hypothetical protein